MITTRKGGRPLYIGLLCMENREFSQCADLRTLRGVALTDLISVFSLFLFVSTPHSRHRIHFDRRLD